MSLANGLVSPLTSAPALSGQYAGGGSGSGVASITAGNATAVITGTASNPIISSYAGSSTNDIVVFTSPSITATTATAFGSFPGTTQAVNPGEYWMISGVGSCVSTATSANTMGIVLDFVGTTQIFYIYEAPETTASVESSFGFIVKVPPGVTSFDIKVIGSTGSGTISGSIQALNYTKLNLI